MKGIVGRIANNGQLIISGEQSENTNEAIEIDDRTNEENNSENQCFHEDISQAIMNRRAVAAVDASMEGRYMVAHWIVASLNNDTCEVGEITSTKWADRSIPAAEGLGLYNLVKVINKKTKNIPQGEIVVYTDNKKIIKGVNTKIQKESQCVQEASATIEGIKEEISNSTITITVEYSKSKPTPNRSFQQEPGPILMEECDRQSKLRRSALGLEESSNIPWIAKSTPICNGVIQDKAISVLIRETDAVKEEEDYLKEKIPEHWNWIDVEARNCFS